MYKYIAGILGVAVLFWFSVIYKTAMSPVKFPVPEEIKNTRSEPPLYLYIFFSKKNCYDCLQVIHTLNNLPRHFVVRGIVPAGELKDEKELRGITGAAFPLESASKYKKKYVPWYIPSIVGISIDGDVLFVLPGVPGEKEYFENFLDSLYNKILPVFLKNEMKT